MTWRGLYNICCWLVVLVAVVFLSVMLRGGYYIVAEHDDRLLLAWAVCEGERFEVGFVHSLDLSPVIDVFEWTGGGLVLRESRFASFGAGAPIPEDFPGSRLVQVGDIFILTEINRHMPSLSILTHYVPNHHLSFGDREAFLLDLVDPGRSVTISVKRLSKFYRWMYGL